ncbi:hypothetical protein V5799_024088 [Amblyomma americanum]|uniref:Uncharacterized protein n=1 Tax=Amblyomma americanum TaxID=6943 RepID=A0AAQ4ED27_AMBAM
MTPHHAVRWEPATPEAFPEPCVAASHRQKALVAVGFCAGAQGCAPRRRVRVLLEIAAVRSSTARHLNKNKDNQPRSTWRHFLRRYGRSPEGQRLYACDRRGALISEVRCVPILSGAWKSLLLFVQILKSCCGAAQETQLCAMLYHNKLPFPEGTEGSTGQPHHLFVTGAEAEHRVILVHTRRVTVLVARVLYRRRCEADPTVLLVLDHAASPFPTIPRNLVLDVPGALASCVFNTIDDAELAVLQEDLAQDAAHVICPSADRVGRTPPALASRVMRTIKGAEEVAILTQDLAQDAAGAFHPTETLMVRLLPLSRLPSLTPEKTRKNFCTSGWLSAILPLVSLTF